MGYYKDTMYYGPNTQWHHIGCKCSECRYEQMNPRTPKKQKWHRYRVIKNARCSNCDTISYPYMWATGPYKDLVCEKCKES